MNNIVSRGLEKTREDVYNDGFKEGQREAREEIFNNIEEWFDWGVDNKDINYFKRKFIELKKRG